MPSRPVMFTQVENKNKLLFLLRTSKTHWTNKKPQSIKITSSGGMLCPAKYCPFAVIKEYLKFRPTCVNISEPFMVFRDRSVVKPVHARNMLKECFKEMKLDHTLCEFRGFRAGRAVDLEISGVKVEVIRKLGRWQSNAIYFYLSYLR